jgi:uncharacterized membrane protein YhaH (DUF805 family)
MQFAMGPLHVVFVLNDEPASPVKGSSTWRKINMLLLLLLIIMVFILSLIAAMMLTARALLDLQKRGTAPFLAQTPVSTGRTNQSMPAGLWHISCLAATYHDSSDGSEE